MKFNVPANPSMKYGLKESTKPKSKKNSKDKKEKTPVLSIRMPRLLLDRLNKDAEEKNRTATEIVQFVLDQYLQTQD